MILRTLLAILLFLPALGNAANFSDIWWNPAESGWGLTIADHESNIFAVWYTYGADGRPIWFTMPGGQFAGPDRSTVAGRTFSGDVFVTRGPAYTQATFNPAAVVATKVGTATLVFSPNGDGDATARFSYSVNGIVGTKVIERQPFGNAPPDWGADNTDLWYKPTESGWGVSIAQHGNDAFAVWFTYDVDGQPTWFVLPGQAQFAPGFNGFQGKIYATRGPSFANASFDSRAVSVKLAGIASFAMRDDMPDCAGFGTTFTAVVDIAPGGSRSSVNIACPQPFGKVRESAAVTVTEVSCTPSGIGNLAAVAVTIKGVVSKSPQGAYVLPGLFQKDRKDLYYIGTNRILDCGAWHDAGDSSGCRRNNGDPAQTSFTFTGTYPLRDPTNPRVSGDWQLAGAAMRANQFVASYLTSDLKPGCWPPLQ